MINRKRHKEEIKEIFQIYDEIKHQKCFPKDQYACESPFICEFLDACATGSMINYSQRSYKNE